jgi:hypothetical protein
MTVDLALQRLFRVRSELERACTLLGSPSAEVLDRCSVVLRSACSELGYCGPWLSGAQGNAEAQREAHLLQQAVRRVSAILQNAWDFYTKWSQARQALSAGYTPLGEQPTVFRRGLICLTG